MDLLLTLMIAIIVFYKPARHGYTKGVIEGFFGKK